ncbi:hypothetical protein BDM02DRAFT_3144256 [Thelephora ganbajun]|uniref:Uncharacterized protein n=1 Tax=Thelephora ganbajun TaxID=370292 RepID=A0ACB6ZH57_THEGA|nr:hypothetical protein BDM02DRAFT_3144256 [Thelephora ganbajun]
MSQHRTPIKRVSQGSLRALSRSVNYPDAPHGLGFLTPALAELTEEMQTLQSHTQGLRDLENSLTRFNESFASWLYVQNMASLTLDWTQAPTPASFLLGRQRAEHQALAAQAALRTAAVPPPELPQQSATAEQSDLDPDSTSITPSVQVASTTAKAVKKVAKKKLTAKEKRERGLEIEKVVNSLPLEFRGSDHTLRTQIEMVIEALMDNPEKADLVRPPELNQARVHKCFLALANRKIITKDASVCADLGCSSSFICLFLMTRVGAVPLAGPLIPLPRSAFLMIVVFHHPPSFRHNRRID